MTTFTVSTIETMTTSDIVSVINAQEDVILHHAGCDIGFYCDGTHLYAHFIDRKEKDVDPFSSGNSIAETIAKYYAEPLDAIKLIELMSDLQENGLDVELGDEFLNNTLTLDELKFIYYTEITDAPYNNDARASVALHCVKRFGEITGPEDEDIETQLSDFLCDIMHLCDSKDLEFEEIIRKADGHYQAELAEEVEDQ